MFEWTVTTGFLAPDGVTRSSVFFINGRPAHESIIDVGAGDRVVIRVFNGMADAPVSIHWHGQQQLGSADMDGASFISQCPIAPLSSFELC